MNNLIGSKLAETINNLVSGNKHAQCQAVAAINIYLNEESTKKNETQKRKIINYLFEKLHLIESKNCCIALLSMLNKNCLEEIVEPSFLISSMLSLINSKVEKLVILFINKKKKLFCILSFF
jgi:hypothetical protein